MIALSAPLPRLTPLLAEEAAALQAAAFAGLERPYSAAEITALADGRTGFLIAAHAAAPGLPAGIAPPLAGFVLFRTAGGEAEILVIAVAPADRRRGFGAALLAAAEEAAAARGAARMILEVAEGNAPARALYARAGYAPAGRRRNYYRRPDGRREDALVLAREMARPGTPG